MRMPFCSIYGTKSFHIPNQNLSVENAISSEIIQNKRKNYFKQWTTPTTLFSCPALANNFPSDEKWQHDPLFLLEWRVITSSKVKPTRW